jgi:hypothetical protein
MIVDERTYTIQAGKVNEFLDLMRPEILPIQQRILGQLLGYFYTEVGVLNQVVHWWGYADMADRERRRAAMVAYPGWKEMTQPVLALIVAQENRILMATDFGTPPGFRQP